MAEDLIGYRGLVEKAHETLAPLAFRLVVRDALALAAKRGLPGEHHFYITFRTHAPGVIVPQSLRQRFPNDMTIVLQHQFWDLEAHDAGFSVMLKFGGQPQTLVVPYSAITRFVDPSVNALFLMEEPVSGEPDSGDMEYDTLETVHPSPNSAPRGDAAPLQTLPAQGTGTKSQQGAGRRAIAPPKSDGEPGEEPPPGDAAGTVVSLDAFRRK